MKFIYEYRCLEVNLENSGILRVYLCYLPNHIFYLSFNDNCTAKLRVRSNDSSTGLADFVHYSCRSAEKCIARHMLNGTNDQNHVS